MRSLALDYWIRVKSSYWFIPAIMCTAAAVLAFVAVMYSEILDNSWITRFAWLYSNKPEGARSLLATVAGSMITVAGVVFSMTLLMVSHASAQIGPRVLEGFMRDRGSQIVLGTFIATFIYCLLVLRTVTAEPAGADTVFVPHLAIVIAVLLAVLSVAVLIYFVHHVPMRINVTSVIDRIGSAILNQLDEVFPENVGRDMPKTGQAQLPEPPLHSVSVDGKGGYLRIIDDNGLMSIACESDCVLEILVRPGTFCVRGTPIVQVRGNSVEDEVLSQVEASFSWGGSRTQEQDVLFLVDQLAEISGRALSPGVNDQYTAIACIDHMERVLREACERDDPNSQRRDDDGTLRIIASPITLTHLADRFLYPLRQFSRGDGLITAHLAKMLARASEFARCRPDLQRTVRRHLDEIENEAIPAISAPSARAYVRRQLTTQGRDPG